MIWETCMEIYFIKGKLVPVFSSLPASIGSQKPLAENNPNSK